MYMRINNTKTQNKQNRKRNIQKTKINLKQIIKIIKRVFRTQQREKDTKLIAKRT